MPDLPSGSSAEPLRYQTIWVTTGALWSSMTMISRPLASLACVTAGPPGFAGASPEGVSPSGAGAPSEAAVGNVTA